MAGLARPTPTALLSKQVISESFDLLTEVLNENELLHPPSRIYNVDETGIALDDHAPRVIAKRGQKKVRYRTTGNKSQINVIACVSASGQCIPSSVVFDAKRTNVEWRKDEVAGTSYGLSEKGWVDSKLFKGWLSEHFLPIALGAHPLLLLLDGHSSHYQSELVSFAREYGIILFCLPPHTTHDSQPLDASVFKPLKQNWQNACHNFIQSNPSLSITKCRFSGLAWGKTMSPAIICLGFQRCDVYPLNLDAINCSVSVVNPEACLQQVNEGANSQNDSASNLEQLDDAQSSLSSEKAALFECRFEEGYGLPDDEYMKWLHHAHPESVINKTDPTIQRDTLNHTGDDALLISEKFLDEESDLPNEEHAECAHETFSELRTDHLMSSSDCREKSPLSLADAFSDLPVASPLSIVTDELSTEVGLDINAEASIEHEDSKSNNESFITSEPELENESTGRNSLLLDGVSQIMENSKAPEEVVISERLSKGKTDHAVASSSKSKASVAENTKRNKLRYISKYLVQFVPDAKLKSKKTAVRISGARVLTNDKCAAILKEHEEKVKKQQEEKERKKKIGSRTKRKQREEEQKKKKAIAAERKALAATRKAEKEAKKAKVSRNQGGNKVN